MGDISAHREKQRIEADRLGEAASVVGRKALVASTLVLAGKIVASAMRDGQRGVLAETAADVGDVRTDPNFNTALNDDIESSKSSVLEELLDAMEDGLDNEMRFQVTQIKGMSWELADSDVALLPMYPIQGHTCREIVEYIHNQLKYEVAGIIAAPLDGSEFALTVPQQMSELLVRFGDRVAGATREAYFTGVQLGARLTAKAILDAR